MSENNSPAWFLRKSSKAAKLQPETRLYSGRSAQPKHEHEWEHRGELFMVSWARLFSGLSNEVAYEGWLVSIKSPAGSWLRQDGDYMALAAEIARLAGLTKPEGEG